jgi:DNA-directed RNA polymerase specialized sigma24 family protein
MAVSESRWGVYVRLQQKLARRRQVDDYTWGLEAGLNRMLDGSASPENVERAVGSESRKERHRATLHRANTTDHDGIVDADLSAAVDARDALGHIRRSVGSGDWILLRALGEGFDYKDIAGVLKVGPGTLRSRALRLRRALRPAVADVLASVAS